MIKNELSSDICPLLLLFLWLLNLCSFSASFLFQNLNQFPIFYGTTFLFPSVPLALMALLIVFTACPSRDFHTTDLHIPRFGSQEYFQFSTWLSLSEFWFLTSEIWKQQRFQRNWDCGEPIQRGWHRYLGHTSGIIHTLKLCVVPLHFYLLCSSYSGECKNLLYPLFKTEIRLISSSWLYLKTGQIM